MQESESAGQERRSEERLLYPYWQRVAACNAVGDTEGAEFQEVLCRDLSANGISFWCDTAPKTRFFVLHLGTAQSHTDLIVEVKHFTPVHLGGRDKILVGCKFVRRLKS